MFENVTFLIVALKRPQDNDKNLEEQYMIFMYTIYTHTHTHTHTQTYIYIYMRFTGFLFLPEKLVFYNNSFFICLLITARPVYL